MTSNIGSVHLVEGVTERGELTERARERVMAELRGAFRPEFLNRVDEIVVFHALTEEHLKQIVDIQLARLRQRLEERHVQLELTDAAKEHLVRVGYDPAYGARPLKRAIQKEIETPLARLVLQGAIKDGQTVHVDYDGKKGELVFQAR
jgi:ATP-dependent Clp protease ATP-binding subunit ClpB